ncbi:AMP-binding protein [Massilia sp. 9096]|uniref:AMP-binding protein n=1 Tax=Massilia sp. 9096 TaxID=1500894 RepID=UPI000B14C35C|nr:AMP-binding protein [Massilia sp. 9096]
MFQIDRSTMCDTGEGVQWWTHAPSLHRFVADLLSAELGLARPGRPPRATPWPLDLEFVRDLGADSLELHGMATALVDALDLRVAGVDERLLARPCLEDWLDAARTGLAMDAVRLNFRTSGSSGSPKRCTHSLATMWQEVRELARLTPGRRRILTAVPSHHIYGFLFTILLPRALGIDDVVDLRTASPAVALGQARAGDLIVAYPVWWEALVRLDPRFEPDVVGVSSGAPCPDALAARLDAVGLRLLEMYGSSEIAGVGWRDRAGSAFTLLAYWRRDQAAGEQKPDQAPEREAQHERAQQQDYAANHALVRSLPDGGEARYPLQDTLAWQDERQFLPAGRIDQAVQVGGTNVFPAYVADVLKLHPRVLDATVRMMRPDEGRRLKAFVVPRPAPGPATLPGGADEGGEFFTPAAEHAALGEELAVWAAARLSAPERPAAFTFGVRLPRQASGKPADWIIDAA